MLSYEEKLERLTEDDFFRFFLSLGAEPQWGMSGGDKAIKILGYCHWRGADAAHSAIFNPSTLKATCFSECACGMRLHTWVKKALQLDSPHEAQEFIEDWIDNQALDLSGRVARDITCDTIEKEFKPEHIQMVPGMTPAELSSVDFDTSRTLLKRLLWHTADGIDVEILKQYGVGYSKSRETILLPHHNIRGDIVGIYERSFRPLRRIISQQHPEMPYKQLLQYPRAKYVPLLRAEEFRTEEKTSWSFPNSRNLYGLHLAVESINQTGKAIVFEGGKSVMLARQYGYPYAVATHTFGVHTNHIAMLIECGAKEIILAFDKQYQTTNGDDFQLYEHKTKDIAKQVSEYVNISRIIDTNNKLQFKDAPIDQGREVFISLMDSREKLYDKPKNEPKSRTFVLPAIDRRWRDNKRKEMEALGLEDLLITV